MHQSHNIPWHTFSKHYKPSRNHPESMTNPNLINILPLKTPQISQDVNHFIRKFADTIRSFAITERSKYPSPEECKVQAQTSGKLFSDELKDKYPGILNDENQKIERWISGDDFGVYPHIKSRQELICLFLHENHLLPLLILSNHLQFSMSDLIKRNLDQWREFSHVKSAALRAYIFFNIADALGMFATGEYAESQEYLAIIRNIAKEKDYDNQDTIHIKFLRRCGILLENGEISWEQASRLHEKYEILREYLKDAFALLYRYELFFREESGADPCTEWEVSYCAPISTPSGIPNPVVSSFSYNSIDEAYLPIWRLFPVSMSRSLSLNCP